VFFDWRIIPHTAASKHMQIYDVTQLQVIPPTYLELLWW